MTTSPRLATRARVVTVLRVAVPAVLLAGYADLARGGITAGPLLLAFGYLVLVPALLVIA